MNRKQNNGRIRAFGAVLLTVLLGIGMLGIANAQTDVTAYYTSTYAPATCALSVANTGVPGVQASTLALSSGTPGQLWVENSGSPDSLGTPGTMAVNVAFNDAGAGAAALGGWYTGLTMAPSGSWVSGMSTTWSVDGANYYALQPISTFNEGKAFSSLATGAGYSPIDFMVSAPTTLPAGQYNQQIVISEVC